MEIKTKFDIKEFIIINGLDYKGRIGTIEILNNKEIIYQVFYWNNGTFDNTWLYEDEISKIRK